jgi:hypothetical protein
VMLVVVYVVLDSVVGFSSFALFLHIAKYTFCFSRQVGKLLTNLNERVILLLYFIQE